LAAVVLALGGWWNDAIEWPRHRFAPGPTASRRVREVLASYDPDRAAS
jgi:hypothetical protein